MSNQFATFQPSEVAQNVMDGAAEGDGLSSEVQSLQNNMSVDELRTVLKEMKNISSEPGYEDVLITGDAILFNPNGESLTDSEGNPDTKKWTESKDSKNLLKESTPDKVNTLDSLGEEKAEKAEPEKSQEQHAQELQDELLGRDDSHFHLREQAREKGRPDLIDKSKTVAEKIMNGDDVYDQFSGENNHNQRLLWRLTQAELLSNVTPESEVNVEDFGSSKSVMITDLENGATVLMDESSLGKPQDASVRDDSGIFGTGVMGTSIGAVSADAFITPEDKANETSWSKELSDAMFDAMRGPNWESDQEKMREMMRILKEEPDSPKAQELREKFKDNKLFKFYDAKAHGE